MAQKRKAARTLDEWVHATKVVQRLNTAEQVAGYLALVSEVKRTAAGEWIGALMDSVVVAEDNGVYEHVYTKLWSFPPTTFGPAMVKALPKLLRRMNRHDQVERFLVGLNARPRYLRSFVDAFEMAPNASQKAIRQAVQGWCRNADEWEAVIGHVGGKPPTALQPPREIPTQWPTRWRKFFEEFMGGKAALVHVWEWTSKREAARFAAHLLSQDLGKKWREAEALTNPLFMSFATKHFDDFVAELEGLEPGSRRAAIGYLAKIGRTKPTKKMAQWPEFAARIERMEALARNL